MRTLALVIALAATPAVADTFIDCSDEVPYCNIGDEACFKQSAEMCERLHPPRPFVLYTQAYSGRIGIVRNLTKDECEVKRKQALGYSATAEEKAAAAMFAEEHRCKPDPSMPHVCDIMVQSQPTVTASSADILYAECRDKPLQ